MSHDALTVAVTEYFKAQSSGKLPEIEAALARALGLFAAAAQIEAEAGRDFSLEAVEPTNDAPGTLGYRPLTPLGEALGEAWGRYMAQVEEQTFRHRVVVLETLMGQVSEAFGSVRNQLDNVMLDVNAIKRRISR